MRQTVCVLLLAVVSCAAFAARAAEHEPLVVFLVRHAEKVDASKDPELSAAGSERAALLAEMLRDAKIDHIHSTDFIRTRDTAAPAAAARGLQVETYDPKDLPALVARLRATGGRHLVVGHSNTTPQMVALLGGEPGPEIDEAGEFDRLYVVALGADGAAISLLLHYGAPYTPEPK